MKLYLVLLVAFLPLFASAKVHKKKVSKRALNKKRIDYPKKLVRAIKYEDNTGEHIVVRTRTKKAKSASRPEEGYYEQQLDVRSFSFDGKHWRQKWNIHDQVMECDHEMEVKYVKKTFAITDLDKDGTAEVWVMYRTGCGIDERPGNMKIIMHEGDTRYSMRGRVRMKINEKKYEGGDYVFEQPFYKGPAEFKEYALFLWKANVED